MFNRKNKHLTNETDVFIDKGVNFYKHWQNTTANMDIGTIVAVKTLGQVVRNEEVKQKLKDVTNIGAEEIPLYAVDIIGSKGTRHNNCQMMFPYVHSDPGLGGAGIYFVPQINSSVVFMTSLTGQSIILGFLSGLDKEETGFRNNKEPLQPGSYCLKTSFGNKIILRSGGIILVQSTPACLRRYIPTQDTIRDLCQNYVMTTEGGQIEWAKEPHLQKQTNWRHTLFDHPKNLPDIVPNIVTIDIGQDPDFQGRSIYNLEIKDPTEVTQARLLIRPNGFIDIDTYDTRDAGDPDKGEEAGVIDIDSATDIDITAKDHLRLGSPAPNAEREYPPRKVDDPHANFDGSLAQTTDYIHMTCEVDNYNTVGNLRKSIVGGDEQILVSGQENHVTRGRRNDSVQSSCTFTVSGGFTQTGAPIHLNPSAGGVMGSIKALISSGKLVLQTLADGAMSWADSVKLQISSVIHSQVAGLVDMQNVLGGGTALINYAGGFTNTVNGAIGTPIGADTVIGAVTSFELVNLNGALNLVEGVDFSQTISSGFELLSSPAVQAHLDDGFGAALPSSFDITRGGFDALQGIGLSGAIDGTFGIPDFTPGNLLTQDTGQLFSDLTSGLFYDVGSNPQLMALNVLGPYAPELRLNGPNNFPYIDPITGFSVEDTVYTVADGFNIAP